MNVKTAITRKEQESDLPNPGGLCWASVHTYSSQHASSIKAAVPYAGSLVTAGRTGVQQWETNTGKYVLQHEICANARLNGDLLVLHKLGAMGCQFAAIMLLMSHQTLHTLYKRQSAGFDLQKCSACACKCFWQHWKKQKRIEDA